MGIKLSQDESETFEAIKVGLFTADFVDFSFESDSEIVMGMYGSANAEFITELGFIVQDVKCTARVLAEKLSNSS